MTENIICPYCDYQDKDDLEEYFYNSDNAIIECIKCNKEFSCYREFSIEYSSSRIPCKDGEKHDYRFYYNWNDEDRYKCRYCDKIEIRKRDANEKPNQ